ncbi:PIN domain-containing protein [Microbacterium maritypicum]
MFLLDTNIVSELRRPRPHPGVARWFRSTPRSSLRISVITDLELERWVLLSRRRDPVAATSLKRWLDSVRREMPGPAIDIGADIALLAAALQVPDRRQLSDALIAATALHHGLTLVTRNVRDFDIPGLTVLNPFED